MMPSYYAIKIHIFLSCLPLHFVTAGFFEKNELKTKVDLLLQK